MSILGSKNRLLPLFIMFGILLVTLIINVVFFQWYRKNNLDSYLAGVFEKRDLMHETASPKVILVGGSNVAFGFNSSIVSEGIGLPVVNAGLQGGLGLRFTINEVKPFINSSDIVLISPEYESLFKCLNGGEVLSQMMIVNPASWRNISSFCEIWWLMRVFPSVHTGAIKNMIELERNPSCEFCKSDMSIYSRAAFDPLTGDILTNILAAKPDTDLQFRLGYEVPNYWLKDSIKELNKFNRYVVEENAKLVFVYPNTVTIANKSTLEKLSKLDEILRSELNFLVLNTPAEADFSDDYMFDTIYHLNSQGSAMRSEMLVKELCNSGLENLNCR